MSPQPVPPSATEAIKWIEGKMMYSAGFGVLLMLAAGAGVFYYQHLHDHPPTVIRIGYGSGDPVRRHFLEQLAVYGKQKDFDIQLVVTEGSAETVAMLQRKELELGLITGAIKDPSHGDLFEITPLYMESLQLLVKQELFDAVSKDFGELRDRTIALDTDLSATNLLATELMGFIGLVDRHGTRHFTPMHFHQRDLMRITDRAALPDAIFQIGGLPSYTMRHMITTHHYRLVPLPFGSSFNLEKFREADSPDLFKDTPLHLDRAYVEEFVIPAFSYSVLPPVPAEDTRTIASRLLLLSSHDMDAETARTMLQLVFSPEISDLVRPTLNAELLETPFQFPRHKGTEQYLSSLKPLDVDGAFTNYSRFVEVWGLMIAGYVAAARGLKSWRQRRTSTRKSVGDFLVEVLAVEAEACATCSMDYRTQLDQRLTDIKRSALELHLEETLEDHESLPSLLVTVADARTRIWRPVS